MLCSSHLDKVPFVHTSNFSRHLIDCAVISKLNVEEIPADSFAQAIIRLNDEFHRRISSYRLPYRLLIEEEVEIKIGSKVQQVIRYGMISSMSRKEFNRIFMFL